MTLYISIVVASRPSTTPAESLIRHASLVRYGAPLQVDACTHYGGISIRTQRVHAPNQELTTLRLPT